MDYRNSINEIDLTQSSNKWLEYHNLSKGRNEEIRTIDRDKSSTTKIWSIIIILLSAIIFDTFFIGKNIGISFFIYCLILLVCFYVTNKETIKLRKSAGWFLLIPSLLISFSYTLNNNITLRSMNILMLPILFTSSFLLIIYASLEWYKFRFVKDFFRRILPLTIENMFKPFSFSKDVFASKKEKKSLNKDIILGILITIPVLIVILLLLASSDLVFNYYITDWIPNLDLDFDFGHFLRIFIVFIATFGFMWSFNYPIQRLIVTKKEKTSVSSSIILVLLISLNIVYLLFAIIQSSFLYTNGGKTLPAGITYAQYARTGFFQLVLVTLINLSIIYFSTKYIWYKNEKAKKISKILLSLIVLFTLNMLYASHFKLSLYENYYGFTYLRFYVHYTILTIFILLIISFVGIWSIKVSIAKLTLISLLTMYTVINFFNVDGFIAKRNIQRYMATAKIDMAYNISLSVDAFEEIYSLKDELDYYISYNSKEYINRIIEELDTSTKWYEFNIKKNSIKEFLEDEGYTVEK
ncbi:hypothetical protein SH2C18_44690 [Clostridium sediminicola]|uniref:DUF4153 domain-containing protein n=1 Tax=Clostridium sediminicola TaxID=3114879 RepID=UPI0031F1E3AA